MHRAQPVPSKILERKHQERLLDGHFDRLQKIRPVMSISQPREYRYIVEKPKKIQQQEGKFRQI
jgi:hypothetical protein